MAYRFSLQSVLNHRKFVEEILQKELSLLLRLLADEEGKLQSLENMRITLSGELRDKKKANANVSTIMLYTGFFQRLLGDIQKQKEEVAKAGEEVERKRLEVVEAMKNRKSLEKLKEKRKRAYVGTLEKKEQDFLNEISINRFNREI
ncbi:MAG: flagellar export protein FliJ [Desulfatiglans sp.]|nr:flagellar export protein FliJ [Desulfatiglans sp.]